VIIELFSLDVTAEALQVNIDWNLLFLKGGPVWPNISGRRGHATATILAQLDRPVNAL